MFRRWRKAVDFVATINVLSSSLQMSRQTSEQREVCIVLSLGRRDSAQTRWVVPRVNETLRFDEQLELPVALQKDKSKYLEVQLRLKAPSNKNMLLASGTVDLTPFARFDKVNEDDDSDDEEVCVEEAVVVPLTFVQGTAKGPSLRLSIVVQRKRNKAKPVRRGSIFNTSTSIAGSSSSDTNSNTDEKNSSDSNNDSDNKDTDTVAGEPDVGEAGSTSSTLQLDLDDDVSEAGSTLTDSRTAPAVSPVSVSNSTLPRFESFSLTESADSDTMSLGSSNAAPHERSSTRQALSEATKVFAALSKQTNAGMSQSRRVAQMLVRLSREYSGQETRLVQFLSEEEQYCRRALTEQEQSGSTSVGFTREMVGVLEALLSHVKNTKNTRESTPLDELKNTLRGATETHRQHIDLLNNTRKSVKAAIKNAEKWRSSAMEHLGQLKRAQARASVYVRTPVSEFPDTDDDCLFGVPFPTLEDESELEPDEVIEILREHLLDNDSVDLVQKRLDADRRFVHEGDLVRPLVIGVGAQPSQETLAETLNLADTAAKSCDRSLSHLRSINATLVEHARTLDTCIRDLERTERERREASKSALLYTVRERRLQLQRELAALDEAEKRIEALETDPHNTGEGKDGSQARFFERADRAMVMGDETILHAESTPVLRVSERLRGQEEVQPSAEVRLLQRFFAEERRRQVLKLPGAENVAMRVASATATAAQAAEERVGEVLAVFDVKVEEQRELRRHSVARVREKCFRKADSDVSRVPLQTLIQTLMQRLQWEKYFGETGFVRNALSRGSPACNALAEHLGRRHCFENLSFWHSGIEYLRTVTDSTKSEEEELRQASQFFESYMRNGAPLQVNVSARMRDNCDAALRSLNKTAGTQEFAQALESWRDSLRSALYEVLCLVKANDMKTFFRSSEFATLLYDAWLMTDEERWNVFNSLRPEDDQEDDETSLLGDQRKLASARRL
ncbi:MAG: hypothetical protein MHM6MM_001814 [Cercozoa sp. M6MM]